MNFPIPGKSRFQAVLGSPAIAALASGQYPDLEA
jgi:hypothetical protein